MKKVKAFFAALVLFSIFFMVFYGITENVSFHDPTGEFQTWYNGYRDASSDALRENIDEKTMLVFGSSEFGHGRNSIYHVRNLFSKDELNVMTIGQPYSQSLIHTISLGALEPAVRNRRVVLMLSPTWFKGIKVNRKDFAARFSDSAYIDFLKNKTIPKKLKNRVASRTEILLSANKKKLTRVLLYNAWYLDGVRDPLTALAAQSVSAYSREREKTALLMTQFMSKAETMSSGSRGYQKEQQPDWEKLYEIAEKSSKKHSSNPMYIRDSNWKRSFQSIYNKSQYLHAKTQMDVSEEYDDLGLFLELCKAEKISVCLLIQPVNGYWYDHTGLTEPKREAFEDRIWEIADRYKASVADLSEFDYEPYVLTDAVHPWKAGWVLINAQLYNFYYDKELFS